VILAISIKPFLRWQNETFVITKYEIKSEKIPKAFDGFKIAVLADIQGQGFVTEDDFINSFNRVEADILVIAGDLVDETISGSTEIMEFFFQNARLPEKIYASSGNHDSLGGMFEKLRLGWEKEFNVVFLENKSTEIVKDGEGINLHGISDPRVWEYNAAARVVRNSINYIDVDNDKYNILIFHRANMLDIFEDSGFDLILSGHLHGGQVRLPFIGGFKSPHGEWFPKYSGGKYNVNDNVYIVSRGVGNPVSAPRIFNRPEIVVVILKSV